MEGQFPKCCDLCETDTRINWKCITCKLLMCTKCKDKVHGKFKSADKHKIVDIKEVGQHSDELDFSNLNCEGHDGQTCFMFCQSCNQLVCPQCIAEVHNGHGLVQIAEGFEIQIENVKEIQQQIKIHMEALTKEELKIKLLRETESSKYKETRNLIQGHNDALKREVDKYTEKLIKELDQKWEALQSSLVEEEHKVTAIKKKRKEQHAKVDAIINSNDADQVFKKSNQIVIFTKEAVEPVKLDFAIMPNFIQGKITEYNFGSLQDITRDLVLNINQQFISDITNIFDISTCSDNSFWIGDLDVIQRVKPERNSLKVMSDFNLKTYGMALTPSNDLLLITPGASRLKQISGGVGPVTDSAYSVDPLVLTAVHVTEDFEVMVGAKSPGKYYSATGRRMVIKINTEGKHEKSYEHDGNKQRIFTNVISITSVTGGTIFVVDRLSEDKRGRVVVLGHDGDILNTYTGQPKINTDDKAFEPVCVVTTPLDNIIVKNLNSNILHILNSVGHLITYYNTANIGIINSISLCFTSTCHLYIGCSTAVGSTDKAKLYKVDISHI